MSIVVTTPTGHIGSRVVQLLIQAGIRPTLLVRDPARLSPEVRDAVEVRQGDLNDAEFLLRATEGAEALFSLIPTNYGSSDPVGDAVQVGQNIADAVRKNEIGHAVFLSSAGAHRRSNDPIGALGKVEDLLNATEANVVHLRPGFFYTNLFMDLESVKQGTLFTTIPVDRPMPWNDPRDIGDIAAARLLSPTWTGKSVQAINGPELLSYAEVAAIASAATGKPIQAVLATDEQSHAGMVAGGLPPAIADALVEMSRGLREDTEADFMPTYVTTTPTSFGAWCYANLRPALEAG